MSQMTIYSTIGNQNTGRLVTNDGLYSRNVIERAWNAIIGSTTKDVEATKTKKRDLEDKWIKTVDGEHMCAHREKTR